MRTLTYLSYAQKRDVLRALQVSVRVWSKKFPMRDDLDLTVSYSFWRPDADSPGEARLTDELKAPLLQALTGQPVTAPVKQFSYPGLMRSPRCRANLTPWPLSIAMERGQG